MGWGAAASPRQGSQAAGGGARGGELWAADYGIGGWQQTRPLVASSPSASPLAVAIAPGPERERNEGSLGIPFRLMRCANARRSGLRPAPLISLKSPTPSRVWSHLSAPTRGDGRPAGGVGVGGGGGSRWSAEPRGAIGGTDRRSESAWAVVGDEAEAGGETMRECLSRGRRG